MGPKLVKRLKLSARRKAHFSAGRQAGRAVLSITGERSGLPAAVQRTVLPDGVTARLSANGRRAFRTVRRPLDTQKLLLQNDASARPPEHVQTVSRRDRPGGTRITASRSPSLRSRDSPQARERLFVVIATRYPDSSAGILHGGDRKYQ